MIYAIAILSIYTLSLGFVIGSTKGRVKKLEQAFEELENEAKYKSLLPKIQRYSELSGNVKFHREGQCVILLNFLHNWDKVKLSKVEEKLAALEKAVEIACPKKCVKKK